MNLSFSSILGNDHLSLKVQYVQYLIPTGSTFKKTLWMQREMSQKSRRYCRRPQNYVIFI